MLLVLLGLLVIWLLTDNTVIGWLTWGLAVIMTARVMFGLGIIIGVLT